MKQAVIFGGSGFVGHHLARRLATAGCPDIVIADLQPPRETLPGQRFQPCDVREPIVLPSIGPDATVYNLAAVHRTPGHRDDEYFATNEPGARHVVRFCEETGISRLVFTSSIAVYGPGEDAKIEASPLRPVSAYGRSKVAAEALHRAWAEADSARKLAIARPAVIFGYGEAGNFTRLARTLKRGFFAYPGRRDTVKACGYVGELVASFDFALSRADPVFLYNFCYPEPTTIADICLAFKAVAGLPGPRGTLPLLPMLWAAALFEGLALLGARTSINRARIMKLVQSTNIRPGTLLEAGYSFETDLAEGLRRWKADGLERELA